jgi:hypothetical protein
MNRKVYIEGMLCYCFSGGEYVFVSASTKRHARWNLAVFKGHYGQATKQYVWTLYSTLNVFKHLGSAILASCRPSLGSKCFQLRVQRPVLQSPRSERAQMQDSSRDILELRLPAGLSPSNNTCAPSCSSSIRSHGGKGQGTDIRNTLRIGIPRHPRGVRSPCSQDQT